MKQHIILLVSVLASFLLSVSCASALFGDVNNDGTVNFPDILAVQNDLHKTFGFNPLADINGDSIINLYDLVLIGQHWGETYIVTPPTILSSAPNGILPAGTTNTTINVTTNINAICHYSNGSNTAYANGTAFNTTGTTTHSTLITGLQNNTVYNYYIRCANATNTSIVDTNDYMINFSVSSTPVLNQPIIFGASPTGSINSGITQTLLSLQTKDPIPATCRYSTTPNVAYASMTNTFTFTNGPWNHQQILTSLVSGHTYTYYVRCKNDDAAGVTNTNDYVISFSLTANPTIPSAEPVFNTSTDAIVMNDTMDEYTTPDDMGNLTTSSPVIPKIVPIPSPVMTGSAVNNRNLLITGRNGTGKALRMLMAGGPGQTATNYASTYVHWTHNESHTATQYFQYWVRMNMSVPLNDTVLGIKWFEVWHTYQPGRIQWALQTTYSPSAHTTVWNVFDQANTATQGQQPVGPWLEDVLYNTSNPPDTQWHRLTYEYKPNSGNGTRDGIARMWIDGTKMIDISAASVGVTPPGGEKPWCNDDDLDAISGPDLPVDIIFGATQVTVTPPWILDIDDFVWWYTNGNDVTPPMRSSGLPTGNLSIGTTQATLNVTTDENATCRYSNTSNTAYAAMTNAFTKTGGTNHLVNVTSLVGGNNYSYYVRCMDSAGNTNPDDYVISFSVLADITPPIVSKGSPAGSLNPSINQTMLIIHTNEIGTCKVSNVSNTPYATMPTTMYMGYPQVYTTIVSGLSSGKTYTYYVRCKDSAGNVNTVDYPISFTLNSTDTEVSTEPAMNASGHLVMQDDMEGYTDLTSMGAYPVGSAPRIVPLPSPVATSAPVNTSMNQIISPGHGGTGQALRMIYPAPDGSQHSRVFYTMNTGGSPTLATHFFQYWARATVNGTMTGSVLAVKWFEAWHPTDRIQWNTHDHLPCPTYTHNTYWQVYEKSVLTTCQGNQPVGPYFNENISDGQWHRFTYEYRPNTAVGSRDGIARMWIDGTKIIDISASAVGVIPPGGEWTWSNIDDLDALAVNDGIVYVYWGSAQTTATPAWTYDIDDFSWWYTP